MRAGLLNMVVHPSLSPSQIGVPKSKCAALENWDQSPRVMCVAFGFLKMVGSPFSFKPRDIWGCVKVELPLGS